MPPHGRRHGQGYAIPGQTPGPISGYQGQGGRGGGPGRGGGRQRGRQRGCRWISALPPVGQFSPYGAPPREGSAVIITLEELEALRLVDLEGLEQAEAAAEMGVSRKTLWIDLKSARAKVAEALVNGRAIRIEGGNYAVRENDDAGGLK